MSIRDISAILKKEEARRQKHKQQEISSKAYKLFSEGKTPVQVATILNLGDPEVTELYGEYWKLRELDKLDTIYKETNGKIWIVLKRSEEHTSELQSQSNLVCRLLLEKKKKQAVDHS